MEFFAATWWIWLIAAVLCFTFIFIGQIVRMKKIIDSDFSDRTFSSFFSNMIWIGVIGSLGWICAILFIVGLISFFVLA